MRVSRSRLYPVAHALAAIAFLGAGLPSRAEQAPAAADAGPGVARLAPATPWNIDYGETDCLMQRSFEADGKRYLVTFVQSAPSRTFSLTVAGPEMKSLLGAKELTLALSASGPLTLTQTPLSANLPDYGTALIFNGVALEDMPTQGPDSAQKPGGAGIDPVQAAKADRIMIGAGKRKKGVWFETGSLKPVFAALNTCTTDLLTQWGLDPVQHRSYVPPVFRNGMEFAIYLNEHYPKRAATNGEGGIFSFRLIIEADGTVSSCHVEARTKVYDLDPRCKDIVRIAKFDPARDAQGNPMRSFFATTVTYSTS